MATYIDADLLKKQIEHGAQMTEKRIHPLYLSEQPEADVEPVVRCKDCRYFYVNENTMGEYGCSKHREVDGEYEHTDDDDFCSYGERRW